MSIDYQAVTARDLDLLDNDEAGAPFDVQALVAQIEAALPSFEASGQGDQVELNWSDEDDGGYIQAYITRHCVGVSHGSRGGDAMMDDLTALLDLLMDHGLHVFDPQEGDWLGG